MGNYDDMLKRLAAYRQSLGLLQKQIGGMVGLSQEQYSYLESGTIRVSDGNLRALSAIGLDADYLITGKTYDYSAQELDVLLQEFDDGEEDFVIKLIAEVIVEKAAKGNLKVKDEAEYLSCKDGTAWYEGALKLLEAALRSWDNFSMIEFVREESGLSQIDMAQRLGVGIRKYRDIEKEARYPDSEMLISLYDMSGYQPALFMNLHDRRLLALKMVWQALEEEERSGVLDLIRSIRDII